MAYSDGQLEVLAHEDLRSGWCLDWELLLASYLPLHQGSRGALGLPMLRDPPIMLFSKPMPDSSDSELERATQLLPGSRSGSGEKGPTDGPGVDDLLEDEAEDRERCARERMQQEQEAAHEESLREEADQRLVDHLVGATEGRKRKAVVVELSSGSADAPRVSRTMRVPMDDAGVVQMSLRLWVEDGGDFEDVNTEPAGCLSQVTALEQEETAAGLSSPLLRSRRCSHSGRRGRSPPRKLFAVMAGPPCTSWRASGRFKEARRRSRLGSASWLRLPVWW